MAHDKSIAALSEVEQVLDQWLKALQAGGDPQQLTDAAVLALVEAGAPPGITREVARLAAITAIDKKRKRAGWDEKQLAIFNAARAMLSANALPEEIFALIEMQRDLGGRGRKRRKLSYRVALATFAAAVTVFKKGQTVDAAIVEVATPNGISRADLKNLRNRLNRGLVTDGTEKTYRMMLAAFQTMQRGEIMSILSRTAERFCT